MSSLFLHDNISYWFSTLDILLESYLLMLYSWLVVYAVLKKIFHLYEGDQHYAKTKTDRWSNANPLPSAGCCRENCSFLLYPWGSDSLPPLIRFPHQNLILEPRNGMWDFKQTRCWTAEKCCDHNDLKILLYRKHDWLCWYVWSMLWYDTWRLRCNSAHPQSKWSRSLLAMRSLRYQN